MIPIFIITCDRLEVLKRSMQSYYDCIKTPFKIIILDQGSTFEPTVKFIDRLESEGAKVYRWEENLNDGEKRNLRRDDKKISSDIQDYFKDHPASNYVVTDPDIFFEDVSGDILEAYSYLLKHLPQITIAGPMLRIDDIPDHYPKKTKVISSGWHKNFHARPVKTIDYKGEQIKYVFAPIHTTFGMFRAGYHWMGHRGAVRALMPYAAKHLDWYLDPENLTEDQEYYMKHASVNSHWSKWSLK